MPYKWEIQPPKVKVIASVYITDSFFANENAGEDEDLC